MLRQASDYSKQNPVVVIAIAKGQKETVLTGEQIGEKLSAVLKTGYRDIPSKYFTAPGGDFTAIAFFVKGHAYGPYSLKESLEGIGLAAASFEDVIRREKLASPGAGSNPLPKPPKGTQP